MRSVENAKCGNCKPDKQQCHNIYKLISPAGNCHKWYAVFLITAQKQCRIHSGNKRTRAPYVHFRK